MLNEGNVTKLRMNVQLLANDGGDEPTDNPVDNEQGQQDTPPVEPNKPQEKTFTQDEVNALIEKRLARAVAKMESDRKEAEELAKLSEAERQKKLFEKQVAEFEATKKAFEAEKILNETMTQLSQRGLSTSFAELLRADDAESTLENINNFEAEFNKAVEARVAERLKGTTPRTSTTKANGEITKEQFKKMNIVQKNELLRTNPELLHQLINQ
jgi:hypothetical protein